MNKAVKSESYRVRNSKSTYIYLVVAILTSAILPVLSWVLQILQNLDLDSVLPTANAYASFSEYGRGSIIEIGSVIVLSGLIIHLYTSGVMKQVVSSGQKRSSFILGQYCAFLKYILLIAFAGAASSAAFTLIFEKTDNKLYVLSFVVTIIGTVVSIAAEVAMIMLAAHLFTNIGLTITVMLLITQFSSAAMVGLNVMFKTDVFTKYWYTGLRNSAIDYGTKIQPDQIKAIVLLAILTVILLILTTMIFNRKEIK